MRILERYILKPIVATFAGCLFVFIFLYVLADVLSHLDDILKNHVSVLFIYHYYSTYFPVIFTQTSPIAILLATIFTYGKLTRNNELIAMRSGGLSLWQLSAPLVILGAILSIAIFFTNEKFVPQAKLQAERMKVKIEGGKNTEAKDEIINNLTFYGLENRLFFVNSFDTKNSVMKGITILEHDEEQNLKAKIVASKAAYKNSIWTFYELTKFYFDRYDQITDDTYYSEEQILAITESPQDFLQQRQHPEFMTVSQLEDYIWRLKKSSATAAIRSLSVDLYNRYASAVSCLILILVGIPFSFVIRRRANIFSSFGICIAISFLYFILTSVSLALGKSGVLFPFLAAWIIPALFFSLSLKAITEAA